MHQREASQAILLVWLPCSESDLWYQVQHSHAVPPPPPAGLCPPPPARARPRGSSATCRTPPTGAPRRGTASPPRARQTARPRRSRRGRQGSRQQQGQMAGQQAVQQQARWTRRICWRACTSSRQGGSSSRGSRKVQQQSSSRLGRAKSLEPRSSEWSEVGADVCKGGWAYAGSMMSESYCKQGYKCSGSRVIVMPRSLIGRKSSAQLLVDGALAPGCSGHAWKDAGGCCLCSGPTEVSSRITFVM